LPALRKIGMLPRIGVASPACAHRWADPSTRTILRLMLPALLGVSVAQISLLINTQIASHLAAGSVSWLNNADRLMEFPTAMLGVALGVVLMPQLAAARASADEERYSAMLDWGLRLVVLLAIPCSAALLVFARPLVATLFHYGAFKDSDVDQVALALAGYGSGLLGLVAIKVLAPGYYASQDMRTPMRIAIVALVVTQLLNVALVPCCKHAGLALSIGLGALVNAACCWPACCGAAATSPARAGAASRCRCSRRLRLLAVFLTWASGISPWVAWRRRSCCASARWRHCWPAAADLLWRAVGGGPQAATICPALTRAATLA
jgi:putative peptidoglycan lipid II flippase